MSTIRQNRIGHSLFCKCVVCANSFWPCQHCHGAGKRPHRIYPARWIKCHQCRGTGQQRGAVGLVGLCSWVVTQGPPKEQEDGTPKDSPNCPRTDEATIEALSLPPDKKPLAHMIHFAQTLEVELSAAQASLATAIREKEAFEEVSQQSQATCEKLMQSNQALREENGRLQSSIEAIAKASDEHYVSEQRKRVEAEVRSAALEGENGRLRRALQAILNSDMAMREEDEGRVCKELQDAKAALGQ